MDVSAQRFSMPGSTVRRHAATVELLDESPCSTGYFVLLTLQNDR